MTTVEFQFKMTADGRFTDVKEVLDAETWKQLEAHLCSLASSPKHYDLSRIELAREVCLGDRLFPPGVYLPACQ